MVTEMSRYEMKQYDIRHAVFFKKTTEKWGELSNMCAGFPVVVNGVQIKSPEALYQACRFPHLPEVQKKIVAQGSPMTAKMVSKPYVMDTRKDWESIRILVMKWVLRVKLAQNWDKFSSILLDTGTMEIVELSNKDDFWGAKSIEDNIYLGVNALGRLLMELREHIKHNEKNRFLSVAPLKIDNFKLYGENISFVYDSDMTEPYSPQMNIFDI